MPIIVPEGLAAEPELRAQGVVVAGPSARHVGARRPLRVVLVNLMPDKPTTEHQIARLLGATPRTVDLTLAIPESYRPKTVSPDYLRAVYTPWHRIRHQDYDGLIVTGAPIETLPFAQVHYWDELTEIFDWARGHVHRSLYLCWAAQAALNHYHGVPKHGLDEKLFGVFGHRALDGDHPLLRGFGGTFVAPVSRHTEVRAADLPPGRGLAVLASSPEAGLCLIEDRRTRATYMFNHLEYDTDTLLKEYRRDLAKGVPVPAPKYYFPDDDATRPPTNGWRSYGRLLFRNWLAEIARDAARCDALAQPDAAAVAGACRWSCR